MSTTPMGKDFDSKPSSNYSADPKETPGQEGQPIIDYNTRNASDDREAYADGDVLVRAPLQRRLKGRHVTFIGFGGGIGVGVYVASGAALATAGPAGLLLAYALMGTVSWALMQSVGEITTLLPSAGNFPHFATLFVDRSLGFGMGWNYFLGSGLSVASELSAAAVLIGYWSSLNSAIWITVCLVPMIAVNFAAVKWYGETEVVTASIKIITFVVLIILGIILDLGGGPKHDRIGFRYWNDPGAFNTYPGVTGSLGRFLAFFNTFINAAYSYTGGEVVILAAAECTDPHKQIPRAVRRIVYRIVFFYVIGVIIIGMLVPYTDSRLTSGTDNAASSPFVVAIENAGISVLPSIFNAAVLISAWSAGNTYIYAGSRSLVALSLSGHAPRFLSKASRNGIPYWSVACTSAFGFLAYLSAGSGGAPQAFDWLQDITALTYLLTWGALCFTYIRFYAALKSQGISRDSLPWKSMFQPYLAWYGLLMCTIIVLFSGFPVFMKGNWNASDFVADYISIPLFFIPIAGWKIYKRTKMVKASEADLYTGRLEADYEVPDKPPTTWWGKFLDWLL
ncbi:hypothetical protein L202_08306 [Cryptococcus amylolentus CBS 6039]|uniref:Amino acid permease/ SLC12A domain-containing protein n=1 Tax=Cryptococcus amylolentus CBS 6039 TaxID=1295533 RepID=A0A1E3H997_9TREE|nr:hypothetical protein L202_08306 [Cryptococcus amylolentus CBS 6039]ODN72883.1 hypothetical protein L202_08306 [Cryptococcus amylolentus CBS 6039]